MCGIIVCLALACSMWTHRHKLTRVVKSSQPVFLHIICAGVLILGSSIIPLSVDHGVASQKGCNAACMAFPWLLVGGFSVTFSALYAKTERVHRIIRNGVVFNRAVVTVGDVYRPMILLLGGKLHGKGRGI
jgi:gamma-aminobutyric acid type B receptor